MLNECMQYYSTLCSGSNDTIFVELTLLLNIPHKIIYFQSRHENDNVVLSQNVPQNNVIPDIFFHNHPFPTPYTILQQKNMVVLCSTVGRGCSYF